MHGAYYCICVRGGMNSAAPHNRRLSSAAVIISQSKRGQPESLVRWSDVELFTHVREAASSVAI
jgi:hypothetical protein